MVRICASLGLQIALCLARNGGALEAPTDALFANHRTAFENGGTLCTLGVLATLDNKLSQRNFQYPQNS